MGLNSMVETPMMGTFTLEDLLTKDQLNEEGVLGQQSPNAPEAVITSDMTSPGPHDTNLSQTEIDAIPSWDVKIRLMKEGADKIVDMQDVQKDIELGGTMSQDRTDNIEATFESFYGSVAPRNRFTAFDSKVNYDKASAFMARKIKASMESLITQFEEVNTNAAGEMATAMAKARDFCVFELRDRINAAVQKVHAVCDQLCAGSIILPFEGDQFIDMTKANFLEVDIDKLRHGVPVTEEFRRSFSAMKQVWMENMFLREFMGCLMATYKDTRGDVEVPSIFDGFFLACILTALGDHTSEAMYDKFVCEVDESVENIKTMQDDLVQQIKAAPDSIATVISTNAGVLVEMATKAAANEGEARILGDFIEHCATVAVGLSSLR